MKDTIVLAHGRLQPPTKAHEMLAKKVEDTASDSGADHAMFLSHSHDAKNNPVPYDVKMKYAKKALPTANITHDDNVKNPLEALKWAHAKGYKHVKFVAGSDRVPHYQSLFDKYNGPDKLYHFDSINVVSAGHRDENAGDGMSSVSGSKTRALAKSGDKEGFKKQLASKLSSKDGDTLYDHIHNSEPKLNESVLGPHDGALSVPEDMTHKIRYVVINGRLIAYVSHHTQGVLHAYYEGENGEKTPATVLYPASVNTTPYKFKRDDLPQINKDAFLAQAQKDGIRLYHFNVNTQDLIPIQSEFNEDKVNNLIASPLDSDDNSIISTRDNFILDGHHRWLANYNLGKKATKVTQVNLNADQALKYLKGQDFHQYKSIDEEIDEVLSRDDSKLVLSCVLEGLVEGLTDEAAITQAAWVTLEEVETVTDLIRLTESFENITLKHPIKLIMSAARKEKGCKVTFKTGNSKTLSSKHVAAISHMYNNVNDANKKRIAKMVAHSPEAFDRILDWSSKHSEIRMDEEIEKTVLESALMHGNRAGCCVRIKKGDHAGKIGKIDYSRAGPLEEGGGCFHSVVDKGGNSLGYHHTSNLEELDEDEMNIDGGGMGSSLGPNLGGPVSGPYVQTF